MLSGILQVEAEIRDVSLVSTLECDITSCLNRGL